MVSLEELKKKVLELANKRGNIRNIGIAAHIDHGKTTLSDSLLAGAGLLSEERAGEARALDFLEEEQKRGITIQSANISMVHKFEGEEYLINLIDTPGHVDFGGEVTRAMRAIDGALVLVDAVEGVMPQTETVLRQALREYVKPVLFINKVDRLIKELKLTPEKMQERFIKIINDVNKLIKLYAPTEFKDKWKVSVQDGTVAFGSAIDRWALSFSFMKKKNITFKDILDTYATEDPEKIKELAKKAPLHEIVLDMVVKHLPSPLEAQKYRIPHLWQGDLNSEVGKALLNCDPNGPLVFVVTKIDVDPQAGEIAAGRIFSGTIEVGKEVYQIKANSQAKIQQVFIYKGNKRIPVDKVPSGNIVGVIGLKDVWSGETVSDRMIEPFENIKHIFEPVVTKAIEAKNPKDLPRLIKVLTDLAKEDITIKVHIDKETGQHLISGLGELHLEWVETKIKKYKGVDIITSPPIVVYRESVTKKSPIVEGKSPNKHNKFYIMVEPLEDSVYEAIVRGEIPEGKIKKKREDIWTKLHELGMDKEEAKRVKDIFGGNVLIDMTSGIVHIGEVIEMVMDAFEQVMKEGPLAREPVTKVKVKLMDATLHEDAIHRGPAQVIPAVRDAIKGAMLQADPIILEPVQTIRIDSPTKYMGDITRLIQSRRGRLINTEMDSELDHVALFAKMPVAEMFGFTNDLRSATEGRAFWSLMDSTFEKLPRELQDKVIKSIRERKGLSVE